MTPRRVLVIFLAALALGPLVLSPFSVTMMAGIGLCTLAALALLLLIGTGGVAGAWQAAIVGAGASALLAMRAGTLPAWLAWLGESPWPLGSPRGTCYLVWLLLLLAAWTTRNLLDSRPGRVMRALRGGGAMPQAMGADTVRARGIVFMIAAAQACTAGWLYAHVRNIAVSPPSGWQAGIDALFMAAAGVSAALLLWRSCGSLWPVLMRTRPPRRVSGRDTLCQINMSAEPLPKRPLPPRGDVVLEACRVTRSFALPAAIGGNGSDDGDETGLMVEAGEILALIGPDGAGKSTLLDRLSGLQAPPAGSVLFLGEPVAGRGARHIAQLGMSRTFQDARLAWHMSVLENAAIGAHLRGTHGVLASAWRTDRREEARLLAEAARRIERVGLGAYMHVQTGSLPLGCRRMLELARALASDPCLLLLDEPAAGLHHQEKRDMASLLKKLRAEGLAIVLAERDMDFVVGLADRIVVMSAGWDANPPGSRTRAKDPSRQAMNGKE